MLHKTTRINDTPVIELATHKSISTPWSINVAQVIGSVHMYTILMKYNSMAVYNHTVNNVCKLLVGGALMLFAENYTNLFVLGLYS